MFNIFPAGMFAGAVQTAVSTPVDLLKIRQQLQLAPPGTPHYVGPLQLLGGILRSEGLTGDEGHSQLDAGGYPGNSWWVESCTLWKHSKPSIACLERQTSDCI
jgi:hypothetical protein